MAGRYDFELDAGSTFTFQFTWKQNGGVVPLLDYTAHMQIREKDVDGRVISNLTTENGGIELERYAGVVRVIIPAKDTENLKAHAVYDLELIKGDTVIRVIEGRIKISPNVTRG